MDLSFQDYSNTHSESQRLLIGVYPCLYCERCFSIKRQLKLHYAEAHGEIIPNYEGNLVKF